MSLESEIRALLPRAAEAIEGLSADQFNWKPAEGAWSVAECLAHLNTVNHLYAEAIETAIRESGRRNVAGGSPPQLGWFERRFVNSLEPPYKMKFRAPAKFRPPASVFTSADILEAWAKTHLRLATLAQQAGAVDLKRTKVASPALPLMRVSLLCALMSVAAHDRRHLWQAERVRASMTGAATR